MHVERTNDFGDFNAEIFPAIRGKEAYEIFKKEEVKFLNKRKWPDVFYKINEVNEYDKKEGIAGCFASHLQLWKKCIELNETIGIFEYDALQVRPMPKKYEFDDFLYLSAWRNMGGDPNNYYEEGKGSGVQDYVGYDKWGFKNVVSGTHAYLLKPSGAQALIDGMNKFGWFPADRFMSTNIVDMKKQTLVPAVFKVKESQNYTFNYPAKGN